MNSTVVIGYDRSPAADAALREAAREAAERGASLTVLSAYAWFGTRRPPTPREAADEDLFRKPAEEMVRHGADLALARHPDLEVTPLAAPGVAWEVLAEASLTADLLVVGNRGRGGFSDLLLGSVSLRVLQHAACPVLVVRGGEHDRRGRVVAAVDLDEPCDAILDFAFTEAARGGSRLEAINVWEVPWILAHGRRGEDVARELILINEGRRDRLRQAVRDAKKRHPGVEASSEVDIGAVSAVLEAASQRADVVVTGARSYDAGGRHRLRIGPVTSTLVHHAKCPVAVVPLD